jgi:hypothetical protein
MLNEDYSTNDDTPLWASHKVIEFNTIQEMMLWVSDDESSFSLSDKVYDAMIDCLDNNIEKIIVTTLTVKDYSEIDVIIRQSNFQEILSSYTQKLLKFEKYERLAEVKNQIKKYNLAI